MIHKLYRSKNGDYFACDAPRGAGVEGWDQVTCPDCLAHTTLPVPTPFDAALSNLRRVVSYELPVWYVSAKEASALVDGFDQIRARLATEEGERLQLLEDMGGIETERDALRREVVSLREENATLQAERVRAAGQWGHAEQAAREEQDRTRDEVEAPAEELAYLRGERATVVAWLRAESRAAGVSPDEKRMLLWASSHIERGEHRHEEEEDG